MTLRRLVFVSVGALQDCARGVNAAIAEVERNDPPKPPDSGGRAATAAERALALIALRAATALLSATWRLLSVDLSDGDSVPSSGAPGARGAA